MADKESEQAPQTESGYELDLDDSISAWDQVVQAAVEAVEKEEEPEDGEPEAGVATPEAPVSAARETVSEGPPEAEVAAPDGVEEVVDFEVPEPEAAEAEVAGADEDDTEAKSLREQLVRTLADFDNFRKRAERETAAAKRYALFDVLKDFLGVHDNLDRALAASGSTEDLKKGVEMIARQFMDLLGRYGVDPVEAVGKAFDPMVHEAVLREEGADIEEPTVTNEFQRGYRLHDRLLRPAMVSVAMPAPPPEEDREAEESLSEASQAASESSGSEEPQLDERENEEELGETVAQTTS